MQSDTFSIIFLVGFFTLFLAVIIMVIMIMRKSYKMEKRAENWRNNDIKVNDEIWMSRGRNYKELEATITSIEGDDVIISARVNKNEIYPNEN